jgi:hypothetical protein
LLHVQRDGSLVPFEKIRTTSKAQARSNTEWYQG